MTISANDSVSTEDTAATGVTLGRSLELYRDMSVALNARIARCDTGSGGDAVCAQNVEAIRSHHRFLISVLDFEAGLGTRTPSPGTGASSALDLDGARAEILARLALWSGEA